MLQDNERYILSTDKATVIRDVLSLVFAAVESERGITPDTSPGVDAFTKGGFDRMILELRRPKSPHAGIHPWVRKIRVSRLGRVLVVTGDATSCEILDEIEVLRRPHFPPRYLTSSLRAFGRSLFGTLRMVHPQS